MIYLTNPRFLTLWKSLRLEVADSGLAQVDTTWNMVNVCSPYSRLYFISHGGGILTLRGREIPLKEGCVYLIPAGLLYNYRCDASMEQLYFHVNITQVNGMDLFYGCDTVYEHDAPAEDLEKVLVLYRSQRMEDAFLLQGLLWEELGRFIQMADLQEAQTKIYSGMVEQVFRLAQNPVSAGNHVRSLADRLHVSESTLSKRFRAETGMSPGVYLEQLVIQKACRLLIETNLTGSEIAYECGYTDVDYFRRLFKKYMGITAKEYRQAYCLVLPEDRVGK